MFGKRMCYRCGRRLRPIPVGAGQLIWPVHTMADPHSRLRKVIRYIRGTAPELRYSAETKCPRSGSPLTKSER